MKERKYLDYNGLQTFWVNTRDYINRKVSEADISESVQEALNNKIDRDEVELVTQEDLEEMFEE